MCSSTQLLFKSARWSLDEEKINRLHEPLAVSWCGRDPLCSARSDTFLRSLRLASCFLARAPALLLYRHGIKPRRWLQRIPQIIAGKLAVAPGPIPLRQPDCQYCVWHKIVFGIRTHPGSLTIVPERWELPRSLKKIPVSFAVPTRQHAHMAQGLDHSNGAVRVDSSQGKPARMRVHPKSSRITPDGTSHLAQTGGFASYR